MMHWCNNYCGTDALFEFLDEQVDLTQKNYFITHKENNR